MTNSSATASTPSRAVLLYSTVDTFDLARGPVAYALNLCERVRGAMTGYLLNLDANADPSAEARSLDQLRAQFDQRADRNLANAQALAAAAQGRGVVAETVTKIDHSRGVTGSLADRARLHDIVVTGADRRGLMSDRMIAESLLFEAGRPMLVVPGDHSGQFACGRIVVAWDNSRNAARALGDALALLPGVEEVVLVTIGGERAVHTSLSDEQTVQSIARRGVSARLVRHEANGAPVGEAIQTAAGDLGADLVVMGGFGHSRLRDFVLGGATLSVLDNPRLPLLISH